MNKKLLLLLLAGILAVGATTFAMDTQAAEAVTPVGAKQVAGAVAGTDASTEVATSGEARGTISIKDDTEKDIKDAVDSDHLVDYLIADETITGTWTQVLDVRKEISDDKYNSEQRVTFKNRVGVKLTKKLSLALTSNQQINSPHGNYNKGDYFETNVLYDNGTIFGTDITSSQLFYYKRDEDLNGETYGIRQRFAFDRYLGEHADIGRFDITFEEDRNDGSDDSNTSKEKSENVENVALELKLGWKYFEEQKTGTLNPYIAVTTNENVDTHNSNNVTFKTGLEYVVSRGAATDKFGKLKFKGKVETLVFSNRSTFVYEEDGKPDKKWDGGNGIGYLEFALVYDNNLYTSVSGFTKLDFHADGTINPYAFDFNGHSKGAGSTTSSIAAKTRKGDKIDSNVYLKLSQDLNSKLSVSLRGGVKASMNTGESLTSVENHAVGAYVAANIKYVF